MAFIGASVAYQCYGHLGIDMCMALVPDKYRSIIEGFTELMLLVLFIYITASGIKVSWVVKESVTPGLNWSVALIYLPAVCGGALMAFWSIDRIITKWMSFSVKNKRVESQ
jgi:TRAP-type C4-dicarboxylate transport system permease small subunit